jgi:tRNA1(Val) A37 N6-methylase TrmN6
MHAWQNPSARGFGVEAQTISADMASRAAEWNGCTDRVGIVCADFRTITPADLPYVPTVLTGTPPYFPPGTHTLSERPQCGPCRAEFRGSAADYVKVAERLMGSDSEFVVCDAFRYTGRVQGAALDVGLHVRRTLDVIPRYGKDCLFQVFLLSRQPGPGWSDRLVIRGADGDYTPNFKALRESMGMPTRGCSAPSVYQSEPL